VITDWENEKKFRRKNLQIEDLLKEKLLCWTIISKQLKDKTILITGAAGSIK
jgi:FlaA1/EpsC-like NDP-sugar epimerase